MVSPQAGNLIIILVMMQVSKKIPFDNPDVLLGARALYIVSNLIIMGLYVYVWNQINQNKDMKLIKYVEPAPMGSGEEPRPVTTTVMDYDKQQLRSMFRSQMIAIGMMAVMHLYFKYTNPLLIQSIIPVKSTFEANLVKIYVFGRPAVGDLQRPFKSAPGLFGMGQGEVKSDKASVENAEKNWRGGVKEE
ncbi:phosphate transporter [Elaphomyces granulatus]|jgi:hypothetical protein